MCACTEYALKEALACDRGRYDKWSERVFQEFYMQGDAERAAGLPISSFMDRYLIDPFGPPCLLFLLSFTWRREWPGVLCSENPNEAQCQSSFLEYIVGPLFTLGKRLWPAIGPPAAQYEVNVAGLKPLASQPTATTTVRD